MDSHPASLTIREYPISAWFAAAILLISGIFYIARVPGIPVMAIIFIAGGVALLLFSTVLTVTADHMTSTLTLRYRAPLWGSKKEIPLSEVTEINLEMSRSQSSRSSSGGPTYRIVIACRDGKVIPFHSFYSSGTFGKQRKVNQLRTFLGVGGSDDTPMTMLQTSLQQVQGQYQAQQEALTGSNVEERVTDGVHWQLQTIGLGGSVVTRWFSPDKTNPGSFLFLTQKPEGQKTAGGGIMGGVSRFLYQQSLKMYGFSADDTPGLETAEVLAPLDGSLEPHFTAFTCNPAAAHSQLNPWMCAPLADWAARYPLKTIQKAGLFNQLAVMFSPNGLYICNLGSMIPEAVDELTNLGVALVKAL